MPRSIIATQNFNTLYTGLRSIASGRGTTYNVKVFNDGGAVVNLIVTGANVSVEASVIITPIYDSITNEITGYRAADEDRVQTFKRIGDTIVFVRYLLSSTRIIINKI